ncbi:MAG: AAA family ATPase, partial [Patescibacteria group bacterium]|nr:AAA family ATPase [Patescibacteria group bacterium]
MRLLRLDLLAFGPFTNLSLMFERGQAGLHLVYGPNEAGKSSSLRALRQWLYGIPHNSRDSFLHANQNLRIGGVLESADGQRLEFIRRKGRVKTLRAADDVEVLDEARLAAMLGGVDQETFSQRFGIDYDELCRGGEAVVRGGGDLGDILFAAGAGIADLGLIQERLAGEADALFKPRGSTQQINKALSELDGARRTIREALLPTAEWVQCDDALRAAETRRAEIDRQLADARGERSRLQRIASALSEIGRRKQLSAQLDQLADAPLLPPTFPELRSQRVSERRTQRAQELDAKRTLDKLEEQMAAVNVPAELPAHRTAIAALYKGL